MGTGLRKVWRISAGVGLVLIGIVGLILPVMPGWVFIIPGLVILSEHSPAHQTPAGLGDAEVRRCANSVRRQTVCDNGRSA